MADDAVAGVAERFQLLMNVVLVFRHLAVEVGQLDGHDGTDDGHHTKESSTTVRTDGTRHQPQRRSRNTSGAKRNANRTANEMGMKISRAK